MRSPALSPDVERVLNFLGMMAMVGVLLGAVVYQFAYRELPCTLCLLQRLAMAAVAYGAAMNLMLGPAPRHYGVCLVSAVFGLAISIRQSLLHINPYFDQSTGKPTLESSTNPPFGNAVMGLDLYVWGIVIFVAVILAVGVVQLLVRRGERDADADSGEGSGAGARTPGWLGRLASFGVGILFAAVALEAVMVFLECGIGDCPNDGSWDWRLLG